MLYFGIFRFHSYISNDVKKILSLNNMAPVGIFCRNRGRNRLRLQDAISLFSREFFGLPGFLLQKGWRTLQRLTGSICMPTILAKIFTA